MLGADITGLGTVRALARQGIDVTSVMNPRGRPSEYTRYARKVADGGSEGEEYVQLLEELADQFSEPAFLIASADHHVIFMSQYRDILQKRYRYVLPDNAVVDTLMDKAAFARWADQHGLRAPATMVIEDMDAAHQAAEALRFPCILKPTVKLRKWFRTSLHEFGKVVPVASSEELIRIYDQVSSDAPGMVLQESIPGDDESLVFCFVYIDKEGTVRATYEGRKIRQWPPLYGTGSLLVGAPEPEVRQATVDLLQCAGYVGIGSAEFKRDPRDNQLYVIECTVGRPDKNSGLATDAGLNIPYLAYCDAVGLPLPEMHIKRPGLKWLDERADVAATRVYRRDLGLSLRQWLNSLRGPRTYALASWDDPLPAAYLAMGFLARSVGLRNKWWR